MLRLEITTKEIIPKIIVDKYFQTNVAGLFAIGDFTSNQGLANKGVEEGINAATHQAYHKKKSDDTPDAQDQ